MELVELVLAPLLISGLISYLATPWVIKFANKYNLIDDPKTSKHPKTIITKPTPRGGGLAIYLGIFVTAFLFLPIDKHFIGIFLGASVLVAMGLIDDRVNINPYKRLLLQFVAAAMPIAAGIGIAYITNPFNGVFDLSHPRISFELFGDVKNIWILSDLFALVWIVFMMNILNMGAKGVDGQLTGVVAIAALTLLVLSFGFSADITQWPVIVLAAITGGAYLGFLPAHKFPQKIMPSFSGSMLAGYVLAVLSILSTAKVGTLLVVLGVPIIDTGYVVVRRILSGKSPVWGDGGHLHHRLLDKGFSKAQVSYFYWAVSFVLAVLALNLSAEDKLYTIVGVAALVGGVILWLRPKV